MELDVQMDLLTHEIDEGTTVHEHMEYYECNVSSPAYWNEARRTQQADELGRAFVMFFSLHETLLAVHDLMHAETALAELRQAI